MEIIEGWVGGRLVVGRGVRGMNGLLTKVQVLAILSIQLDDDKYGLLPQILPSINPEML